MICPVCAYDDDAPVTEIYKVELTGFALDSLNKTGTNSKINRRYKGVYSKYLRHLRKHVESVPTAEDKRRVMITRQYGKGKSGRWKRDYDYGNLVGGCKPLLDAMTELGFIVDDRPSMLSDYYFQERSPTGVDNIVIIIEEGTF